MVATRMKMRTVSFFEVRNADGSKIDEALEWDEILDDLADQAANECRHRVFGVDHWGRVYYHDNDPAFILARSREEGVSVFDIESESFIDHESQASSPYVELSIARFIEGTNRFGFVLNSNASSRTTTMQEWINSHRIFKEDISIVPLVSQRTLAKIDGAQEARLLRVRLDRDEAASLSDASGLFSAVSNLRSRHGSVDLELVVRVKGKPDQAHQEERVSILQSAREMTGQRYSSAIVELVDYDASGRAVYDEVNFVNDLIARKMKVSVTDAHGNPVRIPSAIAAINDAATALRDEFAALD